MAHFGVAHEGAEERGLVLSHLAAGFGIGERHGADNASAIEQCGKFKGIRRGITLRVERGLD